jgi:hypothetical protein
MPHAPGRFRCFRAGAALALVLAAASCSATADPGARGGGGTTGATTGSGGAPAPGVAGATGSSNGVGGAGAGGASGLTADAGVTDVRLPGLGGAPGMGGAPGAGGRTGAGGATADAGVRDAASGAGGAPAPTDARAGVDAPPLGATVTVHVAGDSTAAIFPPTDATMRVGWAAALQPLFQSSVRVDDAALSGRSSKSFIDEGAWTALEAKIVPGDYLFVQFAHNDEKMDDPLRYTDPATTYRDNLRLFVSEGRARGAFVVLMTSICRREFSGNVVTASHGAYTTALLAVAKEVGAPVVDMESRTRAWLTALGPVSSVAFFAVGDNTHLIAPGATEVAKLAVAGIRDLGLPLAQRALP